MEFVRIGSTKNRTVVEIELCDEEGCRRRKRCYRGVAEPDSVQDYGHFPLGLDGECGGFLPLPEMPKNATLKRLKDGPYDFDDTPVMDRGSSTFEPKRRRPPKVAFVLQPKRPMKVDETRDLQYWPRNEPPPKGWRVVGPVSGALWRGKIIERVEGKSE